MIIAMGGQVDPSNHPHGAFLISSPQGHSGKTTVTLGLCNALRRRRLSVQPFKKGPDYIDPSWLTAATGRSCRNLDLFLIPEGRLIRSYREASAGADLSIVEGAMGLYDGLDSHGTTAEIARLLGIPIVLVVNTSRMTGSIAAMITGYQHFQEDIRIAGVILNYVSGKRHEQKLREAVERYCKIPVIGSLPRDPELHIAERHLGLIPSVESSETTSLIDRIGSRLEPYFDFDEILKIARSSASPHQTSPIPLLPSPLKGEDENKFPPRRGQEENDFPPFQEENHNIYPPPQGEGTGGGGTKLRRSPTVRIGVFRDRAFNFYYPENFEALIDEGAELRFIDSFRDRLPELDGLYIGGGFPEFFLHELQGNRGLRRDIGDAVERGLPVYAECAGLMYLCRSISWREKSFEMVGVIPSGVRLSEKPEGHGYVAAEVTAENPLFPMGMSVRGHEFHHSSLLDPEALRLAYRIKKGKGIEGKRDGIVYKNLFASYVHLHALGTPEWARNFVSLALRQKKE